MDKIKNFDIVVNTCLADIESRSKKSDFDENDFLLSVVNGFEDGKWREDLFRQFVMNNIAQTGLSADERDNICTIDPYTQITRSIMNLRLVDRENGQGSEIAEIVLYGIMRYHYHALPVVPKIFYKQNSNDNAKELLHDLVYAEDTGDLIKTGFVAFDKISGGFDRGGLVTIGAPSGCGKSTVSTQLAINFARQGYKVVLVPLEMSKKEMGNRILANIGNMELSKIRQHKLDDREKLLLTKRQKRWRKQVNAEGGRLTIFKPEADLDIDEVYAAVSGLQCDVVIVDYISLLKGIDDENQWLRLGTIARKAKINAEVTNRVNIMVCQVSDEGKIRYSGAIKEHSSTSFIWTPNEEEKKSGLIRVEQIKSRNSEPFPFTLKIIWNKMQVESVEDTDVVVPDITDQPIENLASDI